MNHSRRHVWFAVLMLAALTTPQDSPVAAECSFYVGTYTKPGGSAGIYRFRLNTATGAMSAGGLAAESVNPAFLAIDAQAQHLYAVNETGAGGVSAYAIGPGGALELLNRQPAQGDGPCHLTLDPSGRYVLVANYGSGSVAVLPVRDDGSLGDATSIAQHTGSGPHPWRQKSPHAHSVAVLGEFAFSCDLGTDEVRVYRLDRGSGTLTPGEPPAFRATPGAGPRHLAAHGGMVYVLNELGNTVDTLRLEPDTGALIPLQSTSTLPDGYTNASTAAEIVMHPGGRFLYASNRGLDSIAVFSIGLDGAPAIVQHAGTLGRTPRSFALDATGRWLVVANQDSGTLASFGVDATTGRLSPTGHSLALAEPVCVLFIPQVAAPRGD